MTEPMAHRRRHKKPQQDCASHTPVQDMPTRLLAWFDLHGRKHLPWQQNTTAYRVWVSEIMLQQTQVATVIPYYERFMQQFPDLQSLADAPLDQVLALWTGLGYYARARNLHKAACVLIENFNSTFPDDVDTLASLPGIGRSTAGAILAISTGKRAVILDGNVKRVLTRLHRVEGWPGQPAVEKALWHLADAYTPHHRVADYTQAIMDLGATLCTRTRPACDRCPLSEGCAAHRAGETQRFPAPRPSKALPVRQTAWLVIRQGSRWLLEKRPARGIWGGLWSFPEAPLPEDVPAKLGTLGLPKHPPIATKPMFRHTFSHYHLDIIPICITVPLRQKAPAYSHWYTTAEANALGLPGPVAKWLEDNA